MTGGDLLVGLGLVFVIEGLVLTLFPNLPERILEQIRDLPPEALRYSGMFSALLGIFLIWLAT
ncbi:MAG: DUF2065 domain-containing protein [Pseudomonadota bacterium]|uniref:DUF2065 domain-containing protein n=1 Tax=Fodinicurvata fenggangensis TaxID=1121830 RepID=UPI000478896C|nr:DUF2065 domain-containing protein [Fodinicurvata fenggangensis]